MAGRLKGGTAAIALLAITAATPVGILLPKAARGETTLNGANTLGNTYTNNISLSTATTLPALYAPSGTAWTLVNQGTITGSVQPGGRGADFQGGDGVVVNGTISGSQNLISGYGAVYMGPGGLGTVTNFGTISGSGGAAAFGISLADGGTITNSGLIEGSFGILVNGTGTITNSGTLRAGSTVSDAAIKVTNGGAFVSNAGVIDGSTQLGIDLRGGGTVVNAASGYIAGEFIALRVSNAGGTVTNAGTIKSSNSAGIDLLNGGTVENLGTAALISGARSGVLIGVSFGVGAVTNQGTISGGTIFGVYLGTAGGQVTNSGTASRITAGGAAILAAGAATIFNEGTLIATGAAYSGGVRFSAGGQITNSGTASYVSGGPNGIAFINSGNTGTVVNDGTIIGISNAGILLSNSGGAIANIGGLIKGVTAGIKVTAGTVSITNSGVISATGANGIGILFTGGSGTIDNSGTISGGSGTAVKFAGGTNLLIIESGGVLMGTADGSNGTNTLLLEGTGRLSQAQIEGFTTVAFAGDISTIDSSSTVANPDIQAGSTISNQGTITGDLVINTGGTLANGGTVQISTASSNAGILTNSGSIDNTSTLGNSGGISNSGSIGGTGVLANSGTLTNSGTVNFTTTGVTDTGILNNSGTIIGTSTTGVYVGGGGSLTNLAGGYIKGGQYGVQVASGGVVTNAGTILDNVTAGASLASNASLTNQMGGTIGGNVGVVFTGTGASLINAGTITGTGGVAVQFDAGVNNLTIGTGSVLNGSIEGGGGAGQITLAGSGSLGNTIANFGAGSALTVAPGADWTGSGSWTIASVVNSGSFQAGNAGTPLNLTGNFTQNSGGTLKVALDGGGAGSLFNVSGTATLAGTVAATTSGTFVQPSLRYTILTASGGVSGSFGSITVVPALLSPSLSYDADDVFVTLTQNSVASVATTPNQLATALAFDQGHTANPSGFAAGLSSLDQLSGQAVDAALDRLSGESNADLGTMALMAGQQFLGQIHDQQALARAGGPGAPRQYASLSGAPSQNPDANILKPWSIWGSGFGQTGQIAGDGNTHELSETLTGATVGADYKLSSNWRLGGAVGYAHSTFSLQNGGGHGNQDDGLFALYGEYRAGAAYLDGSVGAAIGTGSTHREINLPSGTAYGDTADAQALGSLETGYGFKLGHASLTPFAGIDWGVDNQDGFTESGAGVLDLTVQGQSDVSVRSRLGARLSGEVPLGRLRIATNVTFGWAHELAGTGRTVTSAFVGAPGAAFTVSGTPLPGDTALIGVGFSTAIGQGAAVFLTYDGQLAPGADSHAVTAGFRYNW